VAGLEGLNFFQTFPASHLDILPVTRRNNKIDFEKASLTDERSISPLQQETFGGSPINFSYGQRASNLWKLNHTAYILNLEDSHAV
jgi:hypothetical protein